MRVSRFDDAVKSKNIVELHSQKPYSWGVAAIGEQKVKAL